MSELQLIGEKAKKASRKMSILDSGTKNKALENMAKALINNLSDIFTANETDLQNARNNGMKDSLIDRLKLNEERIIAMAEGLKHITALNDPIGEVDEIWRRPNGLTIGKKRVPLGVIGIIYESRPNVTVDAAGLCLKTGNAVILKGGSDAINSNKVIVRILHEAALKSGLPEGSIQLIEDTSRETAIEMMRLNKYIDVLIPRGGAGLIKTVVQNATIPVIETGTGNCHVYVDKACDIEMAKNIIVNAKTSRPGVCNAVETLLVHKDVAEEFLPIALRSLKEKEVEIRGCVRTKRIFSDAQLAVEQDYYDEFLDLIIAVKIVDSLDEAIEHIDNYGTKHSETIVTTDISNAQKFQNGVDAAAVYVNASTRFTDGFEFGFGAEIGISTQKLHARGPMGLKELTTTKYVINGTGQVRE